MKTILPNGKEKSFKSWENLKQWLDERFDGWDTDILNIPFKSTVYWDLCPFNKDVHGEETFVWDFCKNKLEIELEALAQEI